MHVSPGYALRASAAAAAVGLAVAGCGGGGAAGRPNGPSSVPPTAPGPTPAAPTPGRTPAATCTNNLLDDAVRAALLQADGRAAAEPRSGGTFYGRCGTTAYAVASFVAAPGATTAQQALFAGIGAAPEYFVQRGTAWSRAGRSSDPASVSCASFSQLPGFFKTVWNDCVVAPVISSPGPSADASQVSCTGYAARTYIRALYVQLFPDGSATLTGHPTTVVCGGADDHHFVVGTGTESAHLRPGATVEVLAPVVTRDAPIPVGQLPAYLTGDRESTVFLVTGSLDTATAVSEQYTP